MKTRPNKEYFESKFKGIDEQLGDRWGHRWRASQKFRHDLYISILQRMLPTIDPIKILDVGCGLGELTKRVDELDRKNWIIGMDISQNATRIFKKILNKKMLIEVVGGALPHLPFMANSFDIVICAEVLYYLDMKHQHLSLQNIQTILKPNGFLLLSVPLRDDPKALAFAEQEILNLVLSYFHVEQIQYNYAKIYGIIEKPLLLLYENVDVVRKIREMSEEEFIRWRIKASTRKVKIAKIIRKFNFLPILEAAIPKIRLILSLKTPVIGLYRLTKLLMGKKGRTHIILLLRNNKKIR